MKPSLRVVPVLVLWLCGQGVAARITAIQATAEIPADELLDVGIEVFDPGIPARKTKTEREEMGVYRDLRQSEARFIPYSLKNTLESTGQWGAVRVLPRGSGRTDVRVRGQIVSSTGLELHLRIRVEDATGRVWARMDVKGRADPLAYDEHADEEPYQDLYNRIANNLLAARNRLSTNEIYRIREVSRVRFAAEIVPEVYGDYVATKGNGRVVVHRLPADDDPTMARVDLIRARDDLLIDTVNEFYAGFYVRMRPSYTEFRQYSYEEERALRREKASARGNKLLGGLLILGGLLADGDSYAAQQAREAAVISGYLTVRKGMETSQEAKIHVEAMRELAASFEVAVAPMLVDVEGKTLRLQGSAETQYQEWNRLLTRAFRADAGLPEEAGPEPPPAASGLN